MSWLILGIALYLACSAFFIAEVFVPSAGLLSICATACLVGGAAVFFQHSPAAGWTGIAIAAVLIPTVLTAAYRVFPHTRFGQTVMLKPMDRDKDDAIPDQKELDSLEEQTGVVITALRPVGVCDFSGKRVECLAETDYIEKGQKVRVLSVQGSRVIVRTQETLE